MVIHWEVRPLRTVEEAEAPKVAERTAAKAARDAERAEKLAAKVAKYSARLSKAVEKKNPKIIAEIYDSAPRQLESIGNAAEVYRSIPGAVEIFRLFGLSCQGRDPADVEIQFAMSYGLYHPEKNVYGYRWP
jgi:hypothetical protein